MIISYLGISISSQAVVNYNIPDLFHLIRFAFAGLRLQVEDFSDAIAEEYVVAAFDAFLKPKSLQKLRHTGKGNICVSAAPKNLVKKFVRARHSGIECPKE